MLMILRMSVIDDNLLIESVRKCPHLYDLSDKNYHNLPLTKEAWDTIGQSLNVPGGDCKRKWNSLRDNYRKQLKKIKLNREQGVEPGKKFKHQKAMSFLMPFLIEKSNRTTIATESDFHQFHDDDDDDSASKDSSVCPATVHPVIEILSDGDSCPPTVTNRRPRKRTLHGLHPIAQVLDSYLKTKIAKVDPRPADSLRKFFDAMEESVRGLKPSLQIEIKSKILALITEYEMKNIENSS